MIYTFISKFATIPSKKQIVKIRKIEADPDSDGEKNNTLAEISIALVCCM